MLLRMVLAVSFFLATIVPLLADEPNYKPIDKETIAAYEKLGAKYGKFIPFDAGANRYPFVDDDAAEKGLPGFRFNSQKDEIPNMPAINVPFGLLLKGEKVTDVDLRKIRELGNLTTLMLSGTKVSDTGLKELKGLKNLSTLNLGGANVTDEGVKELKDLKNLSVLNLNSTKVDDVGLMELKNLKSLTALALHGTPVTDVGLNELKDLKNLTFLNLRSTEVTEKGVKQLKEALPKCMIKWSGEASRDKFSGYMLRLAVTTDELKRK